MAAPASGETRAAAGGLGAAQWWWRCLAWSAAHATIAMVAAAVLLGSLGRPFPSLTPAGRFAALLLLCSAGLSLLLPPIAKAAHRRHYPDLGHVGSDIFDVLFLALYAWLYPVVVLFSARSGLDVVYRRRDPGVTGSGVANWALVGFAALQLLSP